MLLREPGKNITERSSSKMYESFFQPTVQAKPSIGKNNDPQEVEADRSADTVTALLKRAPGQQSFFPTQPVIQAKCDKCASEEEGKAVAGNTIQKKAAAHSAAIQMKDGNDTANQELSMRLRSSKGGGQSMDAKTLSEMSNGFGTDFSNVRIHTDSNAVQMNRELGSQAFTNGNDIYFNDGNYAPSSDKGKHLLAHELTHTIQQSSGTSASPEIQRYGGCSSTKDATIDADHSRALDWVSGAIANLASYNGTTPGKVHDALRDHFGGSTSQAFGYWVMGNLIYLRGIAWMAGYQCETVGGSSWACTSNSTLATTFWCVPFVDIRLCPSYFTSSTSQRTTTLIHEWVHKYGCNFDLGYEHEDDYGSNSTVTQLLNADSFANFVRDAH